MTFHGKLLYRPPSKYIHDIQVVSITTGRFQDVAFKPKTVYTIPFSNIDDLSGELRRMLQAQGIPVEGMSVEVLLLNCESKRIHMQKRAATNTRRPLILELPGGAVEQPEETLQHAGLRELLEESGISILGAQPLSHGYFYFWNHSSRRSGANKWLAKFVFVYAFSDLDAWLFNDRIWDSELKMPKGTLPILFDPEEVMDVFSIPENAMEEMVLWDPEHPEIAQNPQQLVIQRETHAIVEDIFHSPLCWKKPPNNSNRICYFERALNSDTPHLKMDRENVPVARLQDEGLEGMVEGVVKRNFMLWRNNAETESSTS